MKTLKFRAVGRPVGQPRTRSTIRRGKGGKVFSGVYDPGTADDWKTIIRNAATAAWDRVPFTGPTSIIATVIFARPKSHLKRNGDVKENAPIWHIGKPDRDNIDKALLDALVDAGILADDKQVCSGGIFKVYVAPGEFPGIEVEIHSITT
jgi:Holliday junction resolvase RusA-like endonuclease